MPLTHISCVVDRSVQTLAGCIACSEAVTAPRGRRCQFTSSILRAMYDTTGREDAGVSASTLTGCTRRSVLEHLYDYTGDPEKLWPALRGNLWHDRVQRFADPQCIVEQRFKRRYGPRDDQWLTGKMDEVDPRMGVIRDYKSGDKPPRKTDVRLGGFKEDWVWQLNVYRWILADGIRMDTGEGVRLTLPKLGIVYLHAGSVTKYSVPVLPAADVETFVVERATEIQYALARKAEADGIEDPDARALAVDGIPWPAPAYHPLRDKICTEWCAVRELCLSRLRPK